MTTARGGAARQGAPPVPGRSHVRQRGQATVELALLLPVLALLLLVVVQVALIGRDAVLVAHAAREAARVAAVDPDPGAAPAAAAAASTGGLDPARLDVSVTGGAGPGSRVQVVVRYRVATDLPLVGPLVGDRTVSATATMRVE